MGASSDRPVWLDNGAGGELSPVLSLYVPIPPKGQQRARFDPRSGRVYTPIDARRYQDAVRAIVEAQLDGEGPFEEPMRVRIRAVFLPPSSKRAKIKRRPSNRKPDIDNVVKAVLDALNPAPKQGWRGVWKDDVQVVDLQARKDWHASQEGIYLNVWRIV